MIICGHIAKLREHTDLLVSHLNLLREKIQKSPELEAGESTVDAERTRILDLLAQLATLPPKIYSIAENAAKNQVAPPERLQELIEVDRLFFKIKHEIEALARIHDECNIELHKQEVIKAVELCREPFELVPPNIRNEIVFLEKFYGDSLNSPDTVIPEIEKLLEKLERHQISIEVFLEGTLDEDPPLSGFRELRTHKGVYSPYQFYDHSFETYREINTCYYEICSAMESLLKENKAEGDFELFLARVRQQKRPIGKMGHIFDAAQFLDQFYSQTYRKYSFKEEIKRVKPLLKRFHAFRKELVIYDTRALAETQKELETFYKGNPDESRFTLIMKRVQHGIDQQTISFEQLETIFDKLRESDINIAVDDVVRGDLNLAITPLHEKKFGRELLERVNIIIGEIEFWLPPEAKQARLKKLKSPIRDLQEDQLQDRNDFFKQMQELDREMEQKLRSAYPERLREAQMILTSFQKMFADKMIRDRLANRLANQSIWDEINPRLEIIQNAIKEATEPNGNKKGQAVLFPSLKKATNELCQLLYDLAMMLFTLFPGAEDQHVTNMAEILSVCNECHDIPTLWAAFSHYHKKIAIPNFLVNETMIKETSKNPMVKARFKGRPAGAV